MNDLKIEPAEPEDKKAIVALFNAEHVTWPWGMGVQFHRFVHGRGRTEYWDKAVLGGEIVGSIHWLLRKDGVRTIHDMVTAPKVRGMGVGRALVKHIGTPVFLKTDVGAPSNEFYKRLGFVKQDTVPTQNGKKFVNTYYLAKEPIVLEPNKPWILTFTGRVVNPFEFKDEDVNIADIAHALACVNRFAGHATTPISVAQHSVYVSKLCDGTPHTLQALLHDASEAYLGDVTKWVKETDAFAAYRVAEEQIQNIIFNHYGCDTTLAPEVVAADKLMVRFEMEKAYGKMYEGQPGYPLVSYDEGLAIGDWAAWPWRKAEMDFLTRFRGCLRESKERT
jgi:GNAT superfamily N-acetyltransferase